LFLQFLLSTPSLSPIFICFVRTGASLGAGRISLVKSDFYDHLIRVLRQAGDLFVTINGQITKNGAENGLRLLWSGGRFLYLAAICAAGVLVFFASRTSPQKKMLKSQFFLGLILFLAGLSPFLILEGSVIPFAVRWSLFLALP
jgi:hypothetical protein